MRLEAHVDSQGCEDHISRMFFDLANPTSSSVNEQAQNGQTARGHCGNTPERATEVDASGVPSVEVSGYVSDL